MNRTSLGLLLKSTLLASAAITAGQVAIAQENADENQARRTLDVVTVTAQKKEESILDVPMAISAFEGEDLELLGIQDTNDLASIVPGFTHSESRFGSPIYSIRGIGFNTENVSSSSPVGVYIDEIAFPFPVMSEGLTFDMQRVEVLKGPQGTLYGRNTTGGLVNFITNRPTDEFESSVKVSYGSFETLEAEGFLSGPLSNNVRGRIAGKYVKSDEGWQESASRPGDTLGKQDKFAIRGALEFDLSENVSVLLTGSHWTDDSDTLAPQAIGVSPQGAAPVVPGFAASVAAIPRTAEGADWDARPPIPWGGTTFTQPPSDFVKDVESTSFALRVDWDLSENTTFTSLTGYSDYSQSNFLDQDGTPFESFSSLSNAEIETLSQEFRVAGDHDKFDYVVGAYFSKDENAENQQPWGGENSLLSFFRGQLAAFADPAFQGDPTFGAFHEAAWGFRNWENFVDITNESWSVFGQVDYDVTENLTATVGLRYTEDSADFQGCTRDNNGDGNIHAFWNVGLAPPFLGPAFTQPALPGECVTFTTNGAGLPNALSITPIMDELEEDNVSARFVLDYQISENANLYGSVSRGYKSGNFFLGAANVDTQFAPVTQESVWAYEIGSKMQLSDTAQLTLAGYFYDYEDKQIFGRVADPIFTTLPALTNAPESEVMGIEADLTIAPTDNFVTRIAANWIDTEITEWQGFDKLGNFTDFAGSNFEFAPEWEINWLATYFHPVTPTIDAQFTLDVSYTSDQQGDFVGRPEYAVDSYTLVGGNIAIFPNDGPWEFSVFGRNLTDEYYWISAHRLTDTNVRYTGRPRTWGAALKFTF